ncbi:MAG: GTP cyclohydrolase [Sphingobacteriales bacterium]|uniref:YciI family protein n=1 Tax=Hydrotalea flava TaxID=714549 RepID=UPI00082B3EA9|nr:YciI family protein [Hydrotalea flava]RTL47802.1 MAG: GTP cyclohydrolase [Sphingobacteriales bacterium]
MFIVDITYKVSTNLIDQHMEAHIAFLEKYYQSGNFIASGRKEPRTGGIILANADSRKTIEQIMAEDPFYVNKLAEWNIIEFKPTKAIKAFTAMLEENE